MDAYSFAEQKGLYRKLVGLPWIEKLSYIPMQLKPIRAMPYVNHNIDRD